MKKNSISKKQKKTVAPGGETKLMAVLGAQQGGPRAARKLTIGLDLGDRASCYCVLDEAGEVIGRGEVVTEKQPLEVLFGKLPASVVALEVGTHSPWVSRLLQELGHEVIVANAR